MDGKDLDKRYALLGEKLRKALPEIEWVWKEAPKLWVAEKPGEIRTLKNLPGDTDWKAVLGEPLAVPLLHDCEAWAGFTLD